MNFVGSLEIILKDRTVDHPSLPQGDGEETKVYNNPFTFVVAADTQLGILSKNIEWETEMRYNRDAVKYINEMSPKPAFVSVCGDLVDMDPDVFIGVRGTKEDCIGIQAAQWADFKKIWGQVSPDVPVLCLCGNHDVGNRPTAESIDRFTSQFGDDYFAFWYSGCYFIAVNSNMYNDPSAVPERFEAQQKWLEERLKYARTAPVNARRLFVFSHHPWFLYDEEETEEMLLKGRNHFPEAYRREQFVPDVYFSIRREYRRVVLGLCKQYAVDACFAGHYHQNLVNKTSWGMPMIVTGAVCNWMLESTAKDTANPENRTDGPGVRIVTVEGVSGEAAAATSNAAAAAGAATGSVVGLGPGFTHCYVCTTPQTAAV